MIPIKFQVVGEEDYAFSIDIRRTGEYMVSSGTYTTEPPRRGFAATAAHASCDHHWRAIVAGRPGPD